MRWWTLLGLALVLAAAVQLVALRTTRAASTPAATWMIGFSGELDRFARDHEGHFPESYGDLLAEGDAVHAANPVDPWDVLYVYERHPLDPRQCRVYTLGDPTRAGAARDTGALALYRFGPRLHWETDLERLPYVWRDALLPGALGKR